MALVTDHLAAGLAALSIRDAFGVMGNGNAYFLDSLSRTSVRFTPVRHEAGAVASADAYYRSSNRLALATTTYGPGFTNAVTALVEARRARIPLVMVTGDAPSGTRRPWDIDQGALLDGLEIPRFGVSASGIVDCVRDAVTTSLVGRTPVVITLPYDLAHAEAGAVPHTAPLALPDPITPSSIGVAQLADLLNSSSRPLLLAGRGAQLAGAKDALDRLAARTGALTSTTALVRGLFGAPQHDLGVSGGFGQPDAMAVVHQADIAIAFGASLNQFTTAFGTLFDPTTHVVQIDIEEGPTSGRVDRYVRGDARLVAELLGELTIPSSAPWREVVDLTEARAWDPGPESGVSEDGLLDPRSAAAALDRLLPRDRVVVSDGGHFMGWANTRWHVAEPGRMLMMGTAFLSIGLGLASVAGVAVARPDSVVVCTTGDGGLLMALADLETAIRVTGGGGVTVVWNDAQYSAETTLYRDALGLDDGPMLIPEVDFAAIAEAFGAEGLVVSKLRDLDRVAEWEASPRSARRHLLVDLRISKTVVAEYQREIIAESTQRH